MSARFEDTGESVYAFNDRVLVVCPSCSRCAIVQIEDGKGGSARITCTACGYAKTGQAQRFTTQNVPRDAYFDLPLWMNVRCGSHDLWARNTAHLDFLEGYVAASLRERPEIDPAHFYYRNRHLSSRLPQWMKDASSRDAVLKGLKRLRQLLADAAT